MHSHRFPLIALTLIAMAVSSQAQVSTRVYNGVDAYGNAVRTTVQTPILDAQSAAGIIARQGVLGANTTSSSTLRYGKPLNNNSNAYCPPGYIAPGYAAPGYGYGYGVPAYPAQPYPYPYPYAGSVNNNYYLPAQPSSLPIAPPAYDWQKPAWITNIPLGTTYSNGYGNGYGAAPAYPNYPGYGYGYGYPAPYPTYNGTYYNGAGTGSIVTQSQTRGSSVSVGRGGISARANNQSSSSSTTVTQPTYDKRYYTQDSRHLPLLPPGVQPNLIIPR